MKIKNFNPMHTVNAVLVLTLVFGTTLWAQTEAPREQDAANSQAAQEAESDPAATLQEGPPRQRAGGERVETGQQPLAQRTSARHLPPKLSRRAGSWSAGF